MSEEKEVDQSVEPKDLPEAVEETPAPVKTPRKKTARKKSEPRAKRKPRQAAQAAPAPKEAPWEIVKRSARSSTEERKATRFLALGKTVAVVPNKGLVFSTRPPSRGGFAELQRKFGSNIILVN